MRDDQVISEFKADIIKIMDVKFESVNKTIAAGAVVTSEQIRELKHDIRNHNGRLRKVEIKEIQNAERVKVLQEGLAGQVGVCEVNKMEYKKMKKLNRLIDWVSEHPYRTTLIVTGLLGSGLTLANAIYHLFI